METEPLPSPCIFIGNLSSTTTESQLRSFFSVCGKIQRVQIVKKDGVSRGFGYITFSSIDEAKSAIKVKHECRFNSKFITVQFAKLSEEEIKELLEKSKSYYPKSSSGNNSRHHRHHHHHKHHHSRHSKKEPESSSDDEDESNSESDSDSSAKSTKSKDKKHRKSHEYSSSSSDSPKSKKSSKKSKRDD